MYDKIVDIVLLIFNFNHCLSSLLPVHWFVLLEIIAPANKNRVVCGMELRL